MKTNGITTIKKFGNLSPSSNGYNHSQIVDDIIQKKSEQFLQTLFIRKK
jgi:hypothetical protein